jgi:tripartite-type tricarboxylate transporter receptor subunit TctC
MAWMLLHVRLSTGNIKHVSGPARCPSGAAEMKSIRRIYALVLSCLSVLCLPCAAQAQSYPDRPIRVIVPFPAGGIVDVLARMVGDEISKTLGQPVIVENRAGAGGNTGADVVAKAPPDGYTLLMSASNILVANPFLYSKMPFDAETAFTPVSNFVAMPMLLVVHPGVEAKTLSDFLALARKEPGKFNFGSPGIGTTGHLSLALLMHLSQIKITHVPYRGTPLAVQDLLAGQIQGLVNEPPTLLPHVTSGKLRALAVVGSERMPLLPDVPTAEEAGLADYVVASWFGMAAPAGTPSEVIGRLHKEIAVALRAPAIQSRFAHTGARLVGNSPEEFAAQIRADRAKWKEIIRIANISAD